MAQRGRGAATRSFVALMMVSMAVLAQDEEPSAEDIAAFNSAYTTFQQALSEGDLNAVLAASESALAAGVTAFGDGSETAGNLYTNHAILLERDGSSQRALAAYESALKSYEAVYDKDAQQLLPVLNGIVRVGNSPRTRARAAVRSLEIFEMHAPDDSLGYAALAAELGQVVAWADPGQAEDLQPALLRAVSVLEEEYGEDSMQLLATLAVLGDVNADRRDPSRQVRQYKRALEIVGDAAGKDSEAYAEMSLRAGRAITMLSASPLGLDYIEDAHDWRRENYGPEHPLIAESALVLGEYAYLGENFRQAPQYFEEALLYYETQPDLRDLQIRLHTMAAMSYEKAGRSNAATEHFLAIGRLAPADGEAEYQPIFKVAPAFPLEAAIGRSEGYVIVEFTVDETGAVRDLQVVDRVGHGSFEAAAIEAASRFRYAPRFVDGEPVAVDGVRNKISFVLDE